MKALVLYSGGLDSRLAVKLLQEQGYKVEALHFNLPFGCGCCNLNCNFKFTQMNDVKLTILDCTKGKLFEEYFDVIREGKHGRGKALNPCKDCKIFMFKKAKKYADKKGIDVIATGEVIGQRPMSQTAHAMKIIDNAIGFELKRPLIEIGIEGRQRKKQMELAKKYDIKYPNPGGGCALCEESYCKKLKPFLKKKKVSYNDVWLLSIGRHFDKSNIILGRDKMENDVLEKQKGILVMPKQPGPTALVKFKKDVVKAKRLIKKYSKKEIKDFNLKNV
jgi:adenylyl- and sulfurtransferase ThiI